jgi:4'-phosphopantetheinyl transferase
MDMSCSRGKVRQFASLLSGEESARSEKFSVIPYRNCYIVRHGILRLLLSAYMNCAAREVEIRSDFRGKPYIVDSADEGALQFSMSHSAGWTVFAFGRSGGIGVDIEQISAFPELREVAYSNFTPSEIKELDSALGKNRIETFFKIWTRKEAVLKAGGEGLLLPLTSVDVSSQSSDVRTWTTQIKGDLSGCKYRLEDVKVAFGFAAAVAVANFMGEFTLNCRRVEFS